MVSYILYYNYSGKIWQALNFIRNAVLLLNLTDFFLAIQSRNQNIGVARFNIGFLAGGFLDRQTKKIPAIRYIWKEMGFPLPSLILLPSFLLSSLFPPSLSSETLWLVITVVDDGVNRLTQQLSSISTAEGQMDTVSEETCTATTERSEQFNPFASPGSTRGAVSGTHSVANQEHSPSPQPIPALSDSQSSRLVLNGIQTGHTHSNAIDLLDNVGSVECQSSTVSATSLELHPLPGSTGCSVDYSDDMQS